MPEARQFSFSYRSTVVSAAGEQVSHPYGTVLDQVQSMTYREFIHQWDANAPKGRHYYAKTQSIKGFSLKSLTH